ncbi:hypothetical protein J6590_029449 [Homalodisca vitripennis]|nr:hypothetical protein J6590_029449 [Homalodisca vitripennis]
MTPLTNRARGRRVTNREATGHYVALSKLSSARDFQRPGRRPACKDWIAQRSLIQAAATFDFA